MASSPLRPNIVILQEIVIIIISFKGRSIVLLIARRFHPTAPGMGHHGGRGTAAAAVIVAYLSHFSSFFIFPIFV